MNVDENFYPALDFLLPSFCLHIPIKLPNFQFGGKKSQLLIQIEKHFFYFCLARKM
jgi:hypothetical protein